jgi:hypothetical protein
MLLSFSKIAEFEIIYHTADDNITPSPGTQTGRTTGDTMTQRHNDTTSATQATGWTTMTTEGQ